MKIKVALIQTNTSSNLELNYNKLDSLLTQAVNSGAKFILTPEVTNFITNDHAFRLENCAKDENDAFIELAKNYSCKYNVWILLGSLVFKSKISGKCVNRSILLSPNGTIVASYDKIHMFDVNLGQSQKYEESKFYSPGHNPTVVDTPFGKVGMSICYDIRFPNLYTFLAKNGANIITIPSAFTKYTGALHWEVLLRSRAIETGSYILAPAQCGIHGNTNRESYGHSMIISPMGEIVYSIENSPGICMGYIDTLNCLTARNKIPNLKNTVDFNIKI